MARLPRLYAPTVVQHVVQRPAAGRQLFVDHDDYSLFTTLLGEAVQAHGLALHAYVLLPLQFRLLATPRDEQSIARAMQTIGRRYVLHLNRKTGRPGPLWLGRYRSTLIDHDAYMIASMHYIERQPVADALVTAPAQWRWSSHLHHVGDEPQAFIVDHPCYWALSNTPFERQAIYRERVGADLDPDLAARIHTAVERGWLLGDAAFAAAMASRLNRRGTPLKRGRPRKDRPVPN